MIIYTFQYGKGPQQQLIAFNHRGGMTKPPSTDLYCAMPLRFFLTLKRLQNVNNVITDIINLFNKKHIYYSEIHKYIKIC